jgi:hypothetical protein
MTPLLHSNSWLGNPDIAFFIYGWRNKVLNILQVFQEFHQGSDEERRVFG